MILDVSNGVLTIDDPSSMLKSDQLSQIYYWGFTQLQDSRCYRLSSPKIISDDVLKLMEIISCRCSGSFRTEGELCHDSRIRSVFISKPPIKKNESAVKLRFYT